MFKTNEYFGGKVKSIAFKSNKSRATVGVMAPGEYEFDTNTVEHMSVVLGEMEVKLPNETEFKKYETGGKFIVPSGVKFQLKIPTETSYLCIYE